MFTENEVAIMLENKSVDEAVYNLKKEFVKDEAKFLEINNHDFLSLVLLSPSVGVALANKSVSLFEELALNKKARKLSKGGYFMKKDPVVIAMGYLIRNFSKWEDRFFNVLVVVMKETFDFDPMSLKVSSEVTPDSFRKEALNAPYGFVRFLSSYFCSDDVDVINVESRKIARVEYDRMVEIGDKLELSKIPLFQHFCATYNIQ